MRIRSRGFLIRDTRNGIAFTTLVAILLASLGITDSTASTGVPNQIVTISSLPTLRADALPVVAGHKWRISSNSNATVLHCLVAYGVVSEFHLRTQQYVNDSAKSYAFVSYAEKLTARPTDVATLLQTCLNSVENPTQAYYSTSSGAFDSDAFMGANKGIRSYSTATLYEGVMILTYWAQAGGSFLNPPPSTAMTDQVIALKELAAIGVTNPFVMRCPNPGSGKNVAIPSAIRGQVTKLFAKLAPAIIYKDRAWEVDIRAESTIPHICIFSWGARQAHSGAVPPNAIRAIEVAVVHAVNPVVGGDTSFVTFAYIPGRGWKKVSLGTSP